MEVADDEMVCPSFVRAMSFHREWSLLGVGILDLQFRILQPTAGAVDALGSGFLVGEEQRLLMHHDPVRVNIK